ncbi:MAG: hypothetical protein ABI175_08945 [Polyangiales bacterium]
MMQRPSPRTMRAARVTVIAIAAAGVLLVACSDKALLPSDTTNDRIYTEEDIEEACAGSKPPPLRLGPDTFAALYEDNFSLRGVGKCQTPACHGNDTGPGGNGMAMYPPKALSAGVSKTKAIPGLRDDRGLYCGLTSHLVVYGGSTKKAVPCRGTDGKDCTCRNGDDCVCGGGPNKGKTCCVPKNDTDPETCRDSPIKCDELCRRLAVMPNGDKDDPKRDSALLIAVGPDKDGNEPFMPLLRSCNANRKLFPEELARISSWLLRGAPYDGDNLEQPAYECPPPVPATP